MNRVSPERAELNRLIAKGVRYLRETIQKEAAAEEAYRKAKAATWTTVKNEGGRTAEHMKAEVDGRTSELRKVRDTAAGEVKAALEVIRLRRQQLSAWQTDQNADGEEFDHAMYGPDEPGVGA
jgi:Na+-translocating ferredoxin:NAD+ oxidoreductase RnfC subunit